MLQAQWQKTDERFKEMFQDMFCRNKGAACMRIKVLSLGRKIKLIFSVFHHMTMFEHEFEKREFQMGGCLNSR